MKRKLLFAGVFIILALAVSCKNPASPIEDDNRTEDDDDNTTSLKKPTIPVQPRDAVYTVGDTASSLTITATVKGKGILSYQWYFNTKNNVTTGTAISGAIKTTYTPPTDPSAVGTKYYYVIVTNTFNQKTAYTASNAAKIIVNPLNAQVPQINNVDVSPAGPYAQDDVITITVDAESVDGGTLTYQWYSNTEDDTAAGTIIPDETGTSFIPPTNARGALYYYVEVTNTIDDNGDGGIKTAVAASGTVVIAIDITYVTITGLSAADKVYDGTTTATVTGTAQLNGVAVGHDVSIVTGTAAFADKNAGTGKTVTFSGWSLGGDDAGYYILYPLPQPANVTADITPVPLTPSIIDPSRTTFTPLSGENTATVTVDVIGLVDGDTLRLTATGFTLTGTTLTYTDTAAFPVPDSNTLNFSSADSNYITVAMLTNITVYDGQVNYTGAVDTFDRRIPVTQTNIAAFNAYANTTNGRTRHYKLAEDIVLASPAPDQSNWTAVGTFTGSFDGQGHTISNLTINTTTGTQGMFGNIGAAGIVKNIGLVGGSIKGGGTLGYVVGINYGTVQNCYATGNVSGSTGYVGGMAGINYGTVQNCYTTGDVSSISSSAGYVGGVAGMNMNGTIQNCYATGNISSTDIYIGGVVGISISTGSNSSTVRNCVALNPSVRITDTRSFLGRVAGIINNSILNNNYARTGMTVQYNWNGITGSDKIINPGLTTIDGADTSTYNTSDFWTTTDNWKTTDDAFAWDFTNVWEWNSTTNLPILRNVGGDQNHTVTP